MSTSQQPPSDPECTLGPEGAGGVEGSEYLLALRDGLLGRAPVEWVAADALVVGFTPRSGGADEEYVRELAGSVTPWPAIWVHRPTMTVVDGVHRLRAVRLRGEDQVAVRFFDGDLQDALLLAVAANVTHGRALPLADRVAAAERIFTARPRWSDRAVAAVAGLSAKKVAQLRRACPPPTTHPADPTHPDPADPGGPAGVAGGAEPAARIGRDGRARPLSSARGRELASRLIRQDPGASLRQIARRAGISPATVADVRDRLRRGE
ncbi:winged helix-turn-helix transcriptional regulator, partial [Streptomyces coacervatus]